MRYFNYYVNLNPNGCTDAAARALSMEHLFIENSRMYKSYYKEGKKTSRRIDRDEAEYLIGDFVKEFEVCFMLKD